jgi:hypothetical protein
MKRCLHGVMTLLVALAESKKRDLPVTSRAEVAHEFGPFPVRSVTSMTSTARYLYILGDCSLISVETAWPWTGQIRNVTNRDEALCKAIDIAAEDVAGGLIYSLENELKRPLIPLPFELYEARLTAFRKGDGQRVRSWTGGESGPGSLLTSRGTFDMAMDGQDVLVAGISHHADEVRRIEAARAGAAWGRLAVWQAHPLDALLPRTPLLAIAVQGEWLYSLRRQGAAILLRRTNRTSGAEVLSREVSPHLGDPLDIAASSSRIYVADGAQLRIFSTRNLAFGRIISLPGVSEPDRVLKVTVAGRYACALLGYSRRVVCFRDVGAEVTAEEEAGRQLESSHSNRTRQSRGWLVE